MIISNFELLLFEIVLHNIKLLKINKFVTVCASRHVFYIITYDKIKLERTNCGQSASFGFIIKSDHAVYENIINRKYRKIVDHLCFPIVFFLFYEKTIY